MGTRLIPKKHIDKFCMSLEIHKGELAEGVCQGNDKRIYRETWKFSNCDTRNIYHQFFDFDRDCKFCSGFKQEGILMLNCVCMDYKGRTRKNYMPAHAIMELKDDIV